MAEDIIDVSWGEEPVNTGKLQEMSNNIRKLRDLVPTTLYKANGIVKDTGVKVMAGSVVAQPTKNRSQTQDIHFGNFFSVGCHPVVVVQTYSEIQKHLQLGVHGLGGAPAPTNVGASVFIWYDGPSGNKGTIDNPVQVAWIAVGW